LKFFAHLVKDPCLANKLRVADESFPAVSAGAPSTGPVTVAADCPVPKPCR
jgi:hypothetical protein